METEKRKGKCIDLETVRLAMTILVSTPFIPMIAATRKVRELEDLKVKMELKNEMEKTRKSLTHQLTLKAYNKLLGKLKGTSTDKRIRRIYWKTMLTLKYRRIKRKVKAELAPFELAYIIAAIDIAREIAETVNKILEDATKIIRDAGARNE